MTNPTFEQISDPERQWIKSQIDSAKTFVAQYASQNPGLDLNALDETWTAWIATSPTDTDEINNSINCIGILFGSMFVSTGEFEWCIATDDWGTDLAVRALPDRGDVIVYPADFVSKRWETKTTDFFADAFSQIMEHLSTTRREWDDAELQT